MRALLVHQGLKETLGELRFGKKKEKNLVSSVIMNCKMP